jgi:iron uptake system EfeUOB component EfeO/EfeM
MSPNFARSAKASASRVSQSCSGLFVLALCLLAGSQVLFAATAQIKISANLGPATVGTAYNGVISASGGTSPYKFASQNLPPGLTLNSSNGRLSGTPEYAGIYSFNVEVVDAAGKTGTGKLALQVGSQIAVSISLAPTSVTVNSASTAQFQASVAHTRNPGVVWTASSGTVSSSGLYTAPAVATNTTAVLTATSVADSTKSASASISVIAPVVGITLSPGDTSVNSSSSAQFQATVTNTSNTAVTWSASKGTVSSSGLYTAPAITSNTTGVLTATSAADSTKSASANLSLIAPVGITLSPTATSVNSAATAQFTASITNTSNTAVSWSASLGTVSSTGLYTAPAITANTTAVLTAVSAADSTKSAAASITLIAPLIVGITLSPVNTSVNSNATAQFQAAITNTSNTAVTWSASKGTVSSNGLYTAPAVKTNTTDVLIATSNADSTKSASANISLIAPPTAKVMLEVLYPPTNPRTQDFQSVQTYLMSNPAVTGGNLSVEWGMIDQGPTASTQYNWSAVDALIVPWATAGKKVNLIVWANSDSTISPCSNGVSNTTGNCGIPSYVWTALGPSNYVTCSTQYGNQQIPNYLSQAAFQLPYQQFMSAMMAKYGADPNIGYIRFGLGHGGETFPSAGWNDTTTICGQAFAAWGYTISAWETYLAGMLNYESNLHASKQLMVGVTPMGVPNTAVPDFIAPIALPMSVGVGSQGFQLSDITNYPNCTADWCNLFARYAGQAPLELQTYLQSCGDNTCATGSLVNLIPFAVTHHVSILEIYYQDWLVAFAPGYPGNSQYGAAYAQVLTAAANATVQ